MLERLIAAGKDPEREQLAAEKAAKHANTPLIQHFDTLGRPVLQIEHNRDSVDADLFYLTKTAIDIEGNLRRVIDARNNPVMQYKYDMLGNIVYQNSTDAGQRWLLPNIVGNPLRTWDERNHEFFFEYDILHRPTIKKVSGGDGATLLDNVYEKIIYGEALPDAAANNLRAKPVIVYDTAGKLETIAFDFKGNALTVFRIFTQNYKDVVDWSGANPDDLLESESFPSDFEYDALNRITRQTAPDESVFLPAYNEANFLDSVQVTQNGNTEFFVKNIDYNEKGHRTKIRYGNDVTTNYFYDKETFRLIRLETKRQTGDPLQDLYYTFDPVGNITHIEDKNVPVIFFNNQKTTGLSSYTYDALYRLIQATGREHIGQAVFGQYDNWNDLPFMKRYSQNDAFAWRNYTQEYDYDSVGNIAEMNHIAADGRWTRTYDYGAGNNRLLSTKVGEDKYDYPHHPQHGYITSMPHLQVMEWNFEEQLQAVARQSVLTGTPETTYYVYDKDGQRARKITENQADEGVTPTKKSQRIYVGGIEIYREYGIADAVTLERKSYHVMDDKNRIAMIETRTQGTDDAPARLVRYQFGNHLGSSCIETDDAARVISYEEYHPYGTTSYQAVDKDIKATAKRYRYTGKERDEESGLNYHGARYYLPWLGRWLSCDPEHWLSSPLSNYEAFANSPIVMIDPDGRQPMIANRYKNIEALKKAVDISYTPAGYEKRWSAIEKGYVYDYVPAKVSVTDKGGKGTNVLSMATPSQGKLDAANKAGLPGKAALGMRYPELVWHKSELEGVRKLALGIKHEGEEAPAITMFGMAKEMYKNLQTKPKGPTYTVGDNVVTMKDATENMLLHVAGQATLTTLYGRNVADLAGDIHERGQPALITGKISATEERQAIDNYSDLVNNLYGQDIGKRLSEKFSSKTAWTPALTAEFFNAIQSEIAAETGLTFKPFDEKNIKIQKFTNLLNEVMGTGEQIKIEEEVIVAPPVQNKTIKVPAQNKTIKMPLLR